MSTVGIIAEYNPFHTGHAYQISEAKRITGAEHAVIIMSGDFVQRGAPAIMDKYVRTRAALEGGADFVLELPVWIATASAADFADGGVAILNALGCIDYLCFGSEEGTLSLLKQAADIFALEPKVYQETLKVQLAKGKSFPKARKAAWEAQTGTPGDFLDLPNNILGIAYLMSLKKFSSTMKPVTIARKGSFHSTELTKTFASASAIRKEMLRQTDFPCKSNNFYNVAGSFSKPKSVLSESDLDTDNYKLNPSDGSRQINNINQDSEITPLYQFLPSDWEKNWCQKSFLRQYPLETADFWSVLKTQLLKQAIHADAFADFPKELANRLAGCHFTCTSYEELADALKTAVYTRSRIDRGLIHLLLQIRQEEVDFFKSNGTASYVRLLGFKKNHASLLKKMMETSQIPVLTKALPPDNLNPAAEKSYQIDVQAANLYETIKCLKFPEYNTPIHEYRQKIIVI